MWLIVLSAVFDFFDGMVARLLGVSSPIGKDLDSLADVVSFWLGSRYPCLPWTGGLGCRELSELWRLHRRGICCTAPGEVQQRHAPVDLVPRTPRPLERTLLDRCCGCHSFLRAVHRCFGYAHHLSGADARTVPADGQRAADVLLQALEGAPEHKWPQLVLIVVAVGSVGMAGLVRLQCDDHRLPPAVTSSSAEGREGLSGVLWHAL